MNSELIIITDRSAVTAGDIVDVVVRALAGAEGRAAVQLRDRELEGGALLALAERLREVTRAAGARLYINDRVDVALAVGADGVHLPESGLPIAKVRALAPALELGRSVHDLAGAQRAAEAGADYLTFAPVFAVPGKGPGAGVEALAEVVRAVSIPVVALGGIAGPEEAEACRAVGAAAIAVIRAVMTARDPARDVRQLLGDVVWACP